MLSASPSSSLVWQSKVAIPKKLAMDWLFNVLACWVCRICTCKAYKVLLKLLGNEVYCTIAQLLGISFADFWQSLSA